MRIGAPKSILYLIKLIGFFAQETLKDKGDGMMRKRMVGVNSGYQQITGVDRSQAEHASAAVDRVKETDQTCEPQAPP